MGLKSDTRPTSAWWKQSSFSFGPNQLLLMDSIKDDAELASEVIALLGRELKVARKRISELERELGGQRQNSIAAPSNADTERADAAEIAMNALMLNFEALKDENIKLRNDLDSLQNDQLRKLKKEEHEVNKPGITMENADDSEMMTRVHELEAALAKSQEKCQKYREKKRTLQSAFDEMDARFKEMFGEDSSHMGGSLSSTNDRNTKFVRLHPVGNIEIQERKQINRIMQSFPSVQGVPRQFDLKPVFRKKQGADITEYFTPKSSRQYLYFERCIIWCGAKSQHALAFGPLYVYEQQGQQEGRWQINKEFKSIEGKTRELFFGAENSVYYAGSFKCHTFKEQAPLGIAKCNDVPNSALAHLVAPRLHSERQFLNWPTLNKLFQDGVLKVDCLGLQCIGFNEDLYDRLRRQFEHEHPRKRRNSISSDDDDESQTRKPQQKKKKQSMK